LIVAILAAVVIAYAAHVYLSPTQGTNADILGATVGIIIIYAAALADRALNINMMSRLAQQVIIVLIPPLALIFLVLGTIFLGIATPTEGGAMGAVGALAMAVGRRRLDLKLMRQALDTTMKLSCFVLFILIGSTVFSLSFQAVDGPVWVEHLLTSLPGGQLGFLIVVNILVFLLAFFLDFFELAFIIIPLIAPVADKLGIDLVWFGVLLAINMQTSFMHPPFGFALFYLRSVAPAEDYDDRITKRPVAKVTTGQIYRGAVPFVVIQVIMVGMVIAFPSLVSRDVGGGPKVDVDKAFQQLRQNSSSGATPASGASSAPGGAATSDDEMTRQLLESIKRDADKKP
ncbi:MAG: TRAP transporter large permease subunit, partial [Caldimonas sp.]